MFYISDLNISALYSWIVPFYYTLDVKGISELFNWKVTYFSSWQDFAYSDVRDVANILQLTFYTITWFASKRVGLLYSVVHMLYL